MEPRSLTKVKSETLACSNSFTTPHPSVRSAYQLGAGLCRPVWAQGQPESHHQRKWGPLSHVSLGSSKCSAMSLGNAPAPEKDVGQREHAQDSAQDEHVATLVSVAIYHVAMTANKPRVEPSMCQPWDSTGYLLDNGWLNPPCREVTLRPQTSRG